MKNADVATGTPMDLGAQKASPKKEVCVTAQDCSFGWQESWLEPNLDSDFFDVGYSNTFPKVLGKKILSQLTIHPKQHSTSTWLNYNDLIVIALYHWIIMDNLSINYLCEVSSVNRFVVCNIFSDRLPEFCLSVH